MSTPDAEAPLLELRGLRVQLPGARGPVQALRGVSFSMARGEKLGLIGESGCGKSLTALAILGLLPEGAQLHGSLRLNGEELVGRPDDALARLRGDRVAMVFQEPMTALNPLHTIGAQVAEPLRLHRGLDARAARAEALRLLERVRLPNAAQRLDAWPHQLSGGQRQRVMIAMALACGPDLLIADEPTTALDVTLQHEVLMLIDELVQGSGMALLLISHDLGVMARHVQRLLVMYAGMVVESGPTAAVFAERAHPYTRGLYAARPRLGATRGTLLPTIPGRVPDLADLPAGCAFADRCEYAGDDCRRAPPPALGVGAQHVARCLHPLAARAVGRGAPVEVRFAVAAGTLATLEGEVRYAAGDALVARSETDRWPIPRATFDSRYRPADAQPQGHDGRYLAQPVPVQARRLDASLDVALPGGRGTLRGAAGDWLVTHADGDLGIVAADVFAATYELIDDDR